MPPSEEIVLAVKTVVAAACGIEEDAIARPVGKILGFARGR
jgi:hypothetical protein